MKIHFILCLFIFVACKKPVNTTSLQVYIPNAFSPNGDQLNEVFKVVVYPQSDLMEFDMRIFNDHRHRVFHTKMHNEGWNGNLDNSGPEMISGSYTYLIQYSDFNGGSYTQSGSLQLLR